MALRRSNSWFAAAEAAPALLLGDIGGGDDDDGANAALPDSEWRADAWRGAVRTRSAENVDVDKDGFASSRLPPPFSLVPAAAARVRE
jgi:hypothetical protein